MKKILAILTGGTIGSKSTGGVLDTGENHALRPLEFYNRFFGEEVSFETVMPLMTLSENMSLDKLGVILKAIEENKDRKDISGIIVTHGSDTLSYTSNIAGMLFSKAELPIVFVAGNKELSDESGNGSVNFKNAVDFISFSGETGVFVSWSNEKEDNTVFSATNICEADNYFDRFSPYNGKAFGKIEGESFTAESRGEVFGFDPENVDLMLKNKVLLIKPYPGLDYSAFDLSKYAAVMHYLYHSSTACVEGEDASILDFIDKCEKSGVRVFIAPLKKCSGKIYSSLERILSKDHVEVLYDCSIERAYAYALLEVNTTTPREVGKKQG
ncbi:MAG: asparaginase [Clostridia bacterium]|nr:asparaginase [Clostridia bacterium]